MKYTLPNGKNVNIPDKEIEKNMKLLEISKEDAIEMWLEDEGYLDNEEQNELDEKAKKVITLFTFHNLTDICCPYQCFC